MSIPINRPFVDNSEDKIPKNGLEEDHSRKKDAPDINWSLKVARIDV